MSKDDRPDVGLCVIIGVVGIRWCDSDQVPADGQGCGRFSTGIKVSASVVWVFLAGRLFGKSLIRH